MGKIIKRSMDWRCEKNSRQKLIQIFYNPLLEKIWRSYYSWMLILGLINNLPLVDFLFFSRWERSTTDSYDYIGDVNKFPAKN